MDKIDDVNRFVAGMITAFITIIIWGFIALYWGSFIHETSLTTKFGDWYRLIWTFSFSIAGWSFAAFSASRGDKYLDKNNKYNIKEFRWNYYFVYPFASIIISIVIFIFFNQQNSTSNYLFYFLTPLTAFFLMFYVDNAWKNILKLPGLP